MHKGSGFILISLFLVQFSLCAQHKRIEKGIASYYHDHLKSHKTANGESYQPTEMTAAHLTLPFNTLVEVINLTNKKSVKVRINDRGPFVERRIIDLSRAAADSIGMIFQGIAKVEIKVLEFGQRTRLSNVTAIASTAKLNAKKQKIIKYDKFITDTLKIINLKENIASVINIPKQFVATLEVEKNDSDIFVYHKKEIQSFTEIEIPDLKPGAVEVNKSDIYVSKEISFGVQIGSFKKRSNMLKLSERLKKNFIEKFNVQEIRKGDTLYYRMVLGEFENENSALRLKSKLEKEFPGCFVIKYNN